MSILTTYCCLATTMNQTNKNQDQSVSILLDHQYLGNPETPSQSTSSSSTTSLGSLQDIPGSSKEADANDLNANSIQQCFQSMLDLTALSDLDSRQQSGCTTNGCKVLRFELKFVNGDTKNGKTTSSLVIPIATSSVSKNQNESPGKGQGLENTKLPALKNEDEKIRKEWKKLNRDFQEEVRYNALLQYTMSLLVKRWAEYLEFTPDQMRKFELENARNLNLSDDVIDMLEDKDLHIWQILDMINDL